MRYIVDVGNEDWSTLLVLAELDIEPFVATLTDSVTLWEESEATIEGKLGSYRHLLSFYSFLPLYAQNLEG